MSKDWTDALSEKCFPEEMAPPSGGWQAISGRLRRRSFLRGGLAAVLLLLCSGAGWLWLLPDRTPVRAVTQRLALSATENPDFARVLELPSATVEAPRPAISMPVEAVTGAEELPPSAQDEPEETAPVENTSVQPMSEVIQEQETESRPEVTPGMDSGRFRNTGRPAGKPRNRVSLGLEGSFSSGNRQSYAMMDYLSYLNNNQVPVSSKGNFSSNHIQAELVPVQVSSVTHYRHDIPLSLGVIVRAPISSRLSAESGVQYTYLHSVEEVSGAVTHQELHLVGVPLGLNFRLFSIGPVDMAAGAGGAVEKCISATFGGISCEEPLWQWSASVNLDAQVHLSPHIALYLQPAYNWYFTQTALITYRTENPRSFSLQAGLRFGL